MLGGQGYGHKLQSDVRPNLSARWTSLTDTPFSGDLCGAFSEFRLIAFWVAIGLEAYHFASSFSRAMHPNRVTKSGFRE